MDQSQESRDVDNNTHVQLTVNYSAFIDSVNIPNSFAILVSGAPAIDKKQII